MKIDMKAKRWRSLRSYAFFKFSSLLWTSRATFRTLQVGARRDDV